MSIARPLDERLLIVIRQSRLRYTARRCQSLQPASKQASSSGSEMIAGPAVDKFSKFRRGPFFICDGFSTLHLYIGNCVRN
jgi:hypothetical protein